MTQSTEPDRDADLPLGPPRRDTRFKLAARIAVAMAVLLVAAAASSLVVVGPGQAVVITEFGSPVRVLTTSGLAWKIPAPIQNTTTIDLCLRTTSSGLQDVGTRDGLRILVQAYLAWQVDADPARVRQFLRAARNDPDDAARQLRSFVGSALQVTASDFDLGDLVNTDLHRERLAAFEQQLLANMSRQALDTYGISIVQVGIERLSLPAETLAATVARMRAERETIAAQRTAKGLRVAAQIRSDAARDARITAAHAQEEAAEIEAKSRREAAEIYATAYRLDPDLYTMVRSLDTINAMIGAKTHLILRTDAAPLRFLVEGPPHAAAPAASPEAAR